MLLQVPFAVAMLQKKVLWRGEVTCFDGSKMDAWAYTLVPGLSLGARPCNV